MISILFWLANPALANLPCVGERLCQVASEDIGIVHYLDPTTVRSANDTDFANAWQGWFTSDNSFEVNATYRKILSLEVFDCDRAMTALRTRVEYDRDGMLIDHRRFKDLDFKDVIPGTIIEAKFEVMCPQS